MRCLEITSSGERDTETLGEQLGKLLSPGFLIALRGELGSGKTCFTRGLVASAAPQSAHLVASPTFAIMNCYSGDLPVYHFDFYRLRGDDDIAELGFEEYFHGVGVCVIEWSERLEELMPQDRLTIAFEHIDDTRRLIRITSHGHISEGVLGRLAEQRRE